jgi:FkbM family methyltransferase
MAYDSYEKLGYPNSIRRLIYKKYWKRKLYEVGNLFYWFCLFPQWLREKRRNLIVERIYHLAGVQSFSQYGEDIVILYLWRTFLGESYSLYYIDIGAHHPTEISNTRLLHDNGAKGINIEPDPELFKRFLVERPEDINLNIGIGIGTNTTADFYVMTEKGKGLNTFIRKIAEQNTQKYQRKGIGLKQIIRVPVKTINTIQEEYKDKKIDFVTIDTEGMDFDIITHWNFEKHRPAFFCIEIDWNIASDFKQYMKSKGYYIFKKTVANIIFVDQRFRKSSISFFIDLFTK